MPTFHLVRVVPALPAVLEPLRDLAQNVRWSWDPAVMALFQRLDADLWQSTGHNPVRMLAEISQDRLTAAAQDPGFRTQLDRARLSLRQHLESRPHPLAADVGESTIVYFCFEFGLSTALPIYSGGLGILAGDTLKTASDLALPFVGIGLHYRRGYFRQYLNSDGWQQEEFADLDYARMPISPERQADGTLLTVEIPFPGRIVIANVWRVQVGSVPLYLLDTNVPSNSPEDRLITDRLYGGDLDTRIQQEIVLGIGGMRLVQKLGIETPICHMNEGHSAFLGLERIRQLMHRHGLGFDDARELSAAATVFTTHTPVPAGIDMFPPGLIDRYFGSIWPELGLSRDEFLALGRQNPTDHQESFSMAVLGIRLSNTVNGVSALHGSVSRLMWRGLWPELPDGEIPIDSVTNGVHHRTWIAPELSGVFDRYLGTAWYERPERRDNWGGVARIPDEELWRAHGRYRDRLISFARARLALQLGAQGAASTHVDEASDVLDPDALTIGFSRRFARYKRATLLFRDSERLARLLNDRNRPVQILIAGKAHPQDEPAKQLIREIIHLIRRPEFRRRIVFLENYDITVAQHLVQGSDIWLNTPLRPQEASGTSGMKAAMNGVLNVSILDGWWAEGYRSGLGWAIGEQEEYPSQEAQDAVESRLLYDLLEEEIIPTFYDRGRDGVPRRWVQMMKASIAELAPRFNTDRMVQEYFEQAYIPASRRWNALSGNNQRRARDLAAWKSSIRARWHTLRIVEGETTDLGELPVGAQLDLHAIVWLGEVRPDEIIVESYFGQVDGRRQVVGGQAVPLSLSSLGEGGRAEYRGRIALESSGLVGYGIRVLPAHADLASPKELNLVCWA